MTDKGFQTLYQGGQCGRNERSNMKAVKRKSSYLDKDKKVNNLKSWNKMNGNKNGDQKRKFH